MRLGWLALPQTPSEMFTESESGPPQACRYFSGNLVAFGDVLLSFLTSHTVDLLKLPRVATVDPGSEGRRRCGFVDENICLGAGPAWV